MKITVKIEDPKFKGQFIKMSMEQYVKFIKEQADLLNVKESKKHLNLARSHPGLKDLSSYPTTNSNSGESVTVSIDSNITDTKEIQKHIIKEINKINSKKHNGGIING